MLELMQLFACGARMKRNHKRANTRPHRHIQAHTHTFCAKPQAVLAGTYCESVLFQSEVIAQGFRLDFISEEVCVCVCVGAYMHVRVRKSVATCQQVCVCACGRVCYVREGVCMYPSACVYVCASVMSIFVKHSPLHPSIHIHTCTHTHTAHT